jgi:AAA+ superfamily predicted ATPase
MVTKRPSFPIGYSVAGEPAIEKVLHTDECMEIYALASNRDLQQILLLHREDGEACLEWWSGLTGTSIRVESIVNVVDLPNFSACARLSVSGEYMDAISHVSSSSDDLESLLFGLVDCVTASQSSGLFPNLSQFVCWREMDGSVHAAAPLAHAPSSERDAVRYLARTFFTMASGIKIDDNTNNVPPLSQWCRGAGGKLSQAIAACLNIERGKRIISTFVELNSELGRQKELSSKDEWRHASTDSGTSKESKGLTKVAGMHELKALLRAEVVEPVRNPEPYQRYGLSIPNGILLYGPPGCGKTYIARALAEELGHHFLEIVPSELASPYVHGSVIRIREVFDEAAERAPAVVFIDEFEALVPVRSGLGGFQHHKAEEVNEILTHLNASSEKRVFVIAATNQPEMIDPAVRRTGRLDKLIYVGPPDAEARRDMLLLHLSNRPLSDDFEAGQIADQLQGYSASDLRFLVDEAARDALVKRAPISSESFQRAMARITPSVPAEVELQYQSIAQRGL